MATEWYVQIAGKTYGPLSSASLKKAAEEGKITPETPVGKDRSGDWFPAKKIQGLFTPKRTAAPGTLTKEVQPLAAQVQEASRATRTAPEIDQWYATKADGKKFGPIAKATLDLWIEERRLDAIDLLWRTGWQEWKKAADVYPSDFVRASLDNSVQNANMQLCPDCSATISKSASTCPQCGCPLGTTQGRQLTGDAPAHPSKKGRPVGIAVLLGLIGSCLLFYAFSESGRLDKIDAAQEAATRSTNELSRTFAEYQGGLRGAIESMRPDKVAEKSDRTSVTTCFILGGIFVGLGFIAIAIRTG